MAERDLADMVPSYAELMRSEEVRRFLAVLAQTPPERFHEEASRLLAGMPPGLALLLQYRFGGLAGPAAGGTGSASLRADVAPTRDLFAVSVGHYDGLDVRSQLLAEAEAATAIRRALPGLLDAESLAQAEHVVACGRNPDGTIRIVYHGPDWPEEQVLEAAERETGLKAWAMTTLLPAPAEESLAPPRGEPWAGGMRRRRSAATGAVPVWVPSLDRYPVVQLRCGWADDGAADRRPLEFTADLDTGCPWCCVPLEPLIQGTARPRLSAFARAMGEQEHLGRPWLCWMLLPEAFRLEVRTAGGWAEFRPEHGGLLATMDWDDRHALSQVRGARQAIAGRCIWRGKVKLTLESTGADWESAPPVTY